MAERVAWLMQGLRLGEPMAWLFVAGLFFLLWSMVLRGLPSPAEKRLQQEVRRTALRSQTSKIVHQTEALWSSRFQASYDQRMTKKMGMLASEFSYTKHWRHQIVAIVVTIVLTVLSGNPFLVIPALGYTLGFVAQREAKKMTKLRRKIGVQLQEAIMEFLNQMSIVHNVFAALGYVAENLEEPFRTAWLEFHSDLMMGKLSKEEAVHRLAQKIRHPHAVSFAYLLLVHLQQGTSINADLLKLKSRIESDQALAKRIGVHNATIVFLTRIVHPVLWAAAIGMNLFEKPLVTTANQSGYGTLTLVMMLVGLATYWMADRITRNTLVDA